MLEYSSQLEAQSLELSRTAAQLRDANDKLTQLSRQKDAFLSQISHELRTPMTSIRSFSEILRDMDLDEADKEKYAGVILDEAERLTRLLDDLLNLSVLENGQVALSMQSGTLSDVIDRAIGAAGLHDKPITVRRKQANEDVILMTDLDRLSQVFINVITNASKYCDASKPELRIIVRDLPTGLAVDFVDNGTGISSEHQQMIFEKFARIADESRAGGTGLGLAICREIMQRLGGNIAYLPGQSGAAFRVHLPRAQALAAQ
jgi:signal transduction histidine kinase